MKKDDIYRSQFRLPYSLYEKLKDSADRNNRSVNAELIARLENSYSAPKETSISSANLLPENFIEYLKKAIMPQSHNENTNTVKVIDLEKNIARVIQGSAVNYLDVDFSLPFDELKPLLVLAMSALIESNPKFRKWEKKLWDFHEGGHHLCFIEIDVGDPNILIITDYQKNL
ncbi:Arc family DNA-binding protein [Entomomonas moraniae]|uniref:Arc family DNA-binding protein n=1 Tax=Entomomonas moraniae TaxID=2213226 RepID=A0A3Q9JJ23_9GAMM|nr:Arc family DNA-binding protein [Entomomonas moraniae]AZS50644.1 Arc family DNA-binding protein [Entomomonas moraniae]